MLKQIIKESVLDLLSGVDAPQPTRLTIDERFVGQIVMVRTYSAGVHFGQLEEKVGQQAILKDSRRVFYWTEACSLSQLAIDGSKDINSCKISMSVPHILLDRVIEVIPMGHDAIDMLCGAAVWKK